MSKTSELGSALSSAQKKKMKLFYQKNIDTKDKQSARKVAVKPGQKVKDVKTGRAVNPSTAPLTKADKSAIPSGQKLNHPKGVMVGRGKFVPRLGAVADKGYYPDGTPMSTKPGVAMSRVESAFRAQKDFLGKQFIKMEQKRLAALKEELKALQEKNKLSKKSGPITKEKLKEDKREKRAQRSEKIGKVAGPVAGVAGIGAMAGFMTGNTGVGTALMGVSAIATIAPMLTNPIGIAVAASVALAAGFFLLNKRMAEARKKQIEYIDSVMAGTKKMQKVGELTGKVGASQIAQKQRETGVRTNEFRRGYDREDNQFGTNFLASDIGKEIFKGFNSTVAQDGPKAAKLLATQLSTYISDGVMSAEQANSVARAIGINLGDMSITSQINGTLRELVGPDGQDLLKNPLKVRINIVTQQNENVKDIVDEAGKLSDQTSKQEEKKIALISAAAIANTRSLQITQANRDAQYQTNQSIIDGLEKQKAATTDKVKQLQLENQIIDAKKKQKTEDIVFAEKNEQNLKAVEANFKKIDKEAPKYGDTYIATLRDSIKISQKDNPFKDLFLQTMSDLKNESLEVKITTAVEGGLLGPKTAIDLIEMFAGEKDAEGKINNIVNTTLTSQDPGVFATFISMMDGSKISSKIKIDILTDEEKFEDRVKVLARLKDIDGDAINLKIFVNEIGPTGLDELAKDFSAIQKIKSPITIKTVSKISTVTDDPTLNMSGLVDIWSKYENATDEIKKTVISEYIAIFKSIGDKEVEDLINNELAAMGPSSPDRMVDRRKQLEAKYYTIDKNSKKVPNAAAAAGALVSQSGVGAPNQIPGDKDGADGAGGKQRDTTFDNILQDLKRTRDASIDAQGGAKELMRILGGKKDLTQFKGIDQQLSKLGANSDFINFVGGLDDAVKANIITIKKGVVAYGKFGPAAKKAYDEKQLGIFSAANAQVINESIKQRDAFVKLKAAGVETADAQEMLADATFMVSLAAQKNPIEIKRMIAEYKNMRFEIQKTLEDTNPEKAFDVEMDKAMKYYDFLEKKARAAAKPEIDRIEKLIEVNDKLIEGMERNIDENYDRPIEKFSQDLAIMDKAAEGINDKYDAQEKALEKISNINEEISQQEKARLTLADALSQGDISAAASVAQEIRANAAENAMQKSSGALQAAKEAELAGLKVSGLTKAQIEEKIYNIEQARLPILAKIRELQDQNYNFSKKELEPITEALKIRIGNIDTERTAWENQKIAIQAAAFEADKTSERFKIGEGIVGKVKEIWESIKDQSRTLTINTVYTTSGGVGSTSGGNGTPGTTFKDPNKEILQAISEGVALMTEAEMIKAMNTGYLSMGGMVPKYFASGGLSKGTDTIPAMLTPGEFVMSKTAVDKYGSMLAAMNDPSFKMLESNKYNGPVSGGNGNANNSSSMYNYNIGITVPQSNANPNDIANAVIGQIKYIDAQRIRGQK
jgi:hypothetical protein